MPKREANDDRSRKAHDILRRALDLEGEARDELALDGFADLRRKLDELLAEDVQATDQLPPESSKRDVKDAGGLKMPDPVDTRSRYELKGEVARGGMGAILKVFDTNLRRNLAMKVVLAQGEETRSGNTSKVDSGIMARFLEEAQVTGQLDHPGVVPVHELGLDSDGRVYFTMRLVKGREFKEIIEEVHAGSEEWTLTRALGVLLKVCETMSFAHDRGVIHRDLKPANVMVGRYGEVYVMDWGLARVEGAEDGHDLRLASSTMAAVSEVNTGRKEARESDLDSPLITMDGTVLGTPFYMPREQAAGMVEEVDERSDVYAVGAMLYHLLVGHMPYHRKGERPSPHTVLAMVLQGPPTPMREIASALPKELVAITEKAMARVREERYGSMGSLGQDLRAHLEGRVVGAHKTGRVTVIRKWILRNKAVFASAILAIIAAAAISWALFQPLKGDVVPAGGMISVLDLLPGEYQIRARIRESLDGEFGSYEGHALIERAHQGRWIHEIFEISGPVRKLKGDSWIGWSRAANRFELSQIDNFSPNAIWCSSAQPEKSESVTMESVADAEFATPKHRWEISVDENGVLTKSMSVVDVDGAVRLHSEYRYLRLQ